MEHRKAHGADRLDVADQAVGDAPGGTPHPGRRAEQLAPGCDPLGGAAAGEHGDIAGLEIVDQRDLDRVGILPRLDLVARHVDPGRARPNRTRASSSGRTNGRSAWFISPRESMTSESTAL